MKRIAMTMLGLVALASTTLKAQDKSWNFRVGAGGNVSQISNYLPGDPHFGLRVSGQVLKNFGNTGFGVLSGLEFTNKGEQFKSGDGGVSFNSLQIPLFASYHIYKLIIERSFLVLYEYLFRSTYLFICHIFLA